MGIQQNNRIASIDLLRGAIMIIMALDHVRDYFLTDSFIYDPLDLQKSSVALFFTRWITHFCAPIFMLLAGLSASLMSEKKTRPQLSRFLLTRGAWLIVLELTVVNFGWTFNLSFPVVLLIVLWALGISMICLAGLIFLPRKLILLLSIAIVAGHNLLDHIRMAGNNLPAFGWALLHEQKPFSWHGETVLVGYPIIPWIAVMALGYCLGGYYVTGYPAERRKKNLIRLGFGALAAFVVIRFINVYGDPVPWTHQANGIRTLLSFIKVNKYPPSLMYILLTEGVALVFLAFTEKAKGAIVNIISIYGRVPMFYYIIHIYLIHVLIMIMTGLFTHVDWYIWILKKPLWTMTDLKYGGFTLPVVYLVWISIVVIMYPLCKRYDVYKRAHKEKWWLSYL